MMYMFGSELLYCGPFNPPKASGNHHDTELTYITHSRLN